MEKYYCDHCRLIYNEEALCKACGCTVSKKIWIEVQNQQDYNSSITPD